MLDEYGFILPFPLFSSSHSYPLPLPHSPSPFEKGLGKKGKRMRGEA